MISSAKHLLRSIAFYLPDRLHSLRRKRELKFSRTEISRPQLVADLSRLPIDRDAIVLVHSSLKSLGFVSGGATMVVEALVEAIVKRNGGTVMLPCYSINGTMHQTLLEQRIFDVSKTPSNLGAIPEAFRHLPEAVRSIHPTHSFAAIGPLAKWLTGTHHSCGTSFGAGSPMAKLREKQGYLLGLGTNLGTVTFYHCLEDIETGFPLAVHTVDSSDRAVPGILRGNVLAVAQRARWGGGSHSNRPSGERRNPRILHRKA